MDNFNNPNYDPSGYNSGYYGDAGAYADAGGQAQGYDGGMYQQSYSADGMDPYYAAQNQYSNYGQQGWNQGEDWTAAGAKSTERGSYYFHTEFTPQLFGFPVTSLAYDNAYDAMYVASPTQSMKTTRLRSHRASMLAIHNTLDGMCYSSSAGHPEAKPAILSQVYDCMYGIKKTVPMTSGREHIPPHAYRPPYGGSQVETSMAMAGGKHGHIGITDMLPLNGYAATISPSAVRIHSHGGFQVHDHDIEGILCGTLHPHSDGGAPTHISVGGITSGNKYSHNDIFCMDIWQGLRVVNSWGFQSKRYNSPKAGVTSMVTSHERGSVIAGCTDGNIRILDGSLRELATIKSHTGGVSSLSVSPDGTLIATTGNSSRVAPNKETSILYGFPDSRIYIYDIRYLGRGGIPHMFSGARGCPRHLTFVPNVEDMPSNRLLVASGQPAGGLQILVPFEEQCEKTTSFITPQLAQGEYISAMGKDNDDLALGTSAGRVLRYRLAGYKSKKNRHGRSNAGNKKQALDMSKLYEEPLTAFSIDPNLLLQNGDPGMRNGNDEKMKSLFSSYVLQADPKISSIGYSVENTTVNFGSLGANPIIPTGRRTVSQSFMKEAATGEGDFVVTIPTSKLGLDVLANHATRPRRHYNNKAPTESKRNPNKFLHCQKLSAFCYEDGLNGRRRQRGQRGQGSEDIPPRYRLQLRPSFKSAGAFDPAEYNDTGLIPGWDYSSTMPNAFASPVLLLLYFVPEIRSTILAAQYNESLFSVRGYEKALSPELGFVFHQIESLYSSALLHPVKANSDQFRPRIGTWAPSNFLTALATMSEAEQLQILDGSPAAVDPPRRPEAFYRFIAYQLDKEVSKNTKTKLMDSLHGLDFISVNQFISESSLSSQSTTRSLTVDLTYDSFSRVEKKTPIRFGTLLQRSLCRETRLRAWNKKSKAYETIVQRKIAISLPEILTLSGACAGRKEEDGLWVWRTDDGAGPWVPEIVEVELLTDGHVSVKEMKFNDDGKIEEVWSTGKPSELPASLSKLVNDVTSRQKFRYRLDAVVSFINDGSEDVGDTEHPGHHILHARVPLGYKSRVLKTQQKKAMERAAQKLDDAKMVLSANVPTDTFKKRAEKVGEKLAALSPKDNDWVLYNGFSVSSTISEDARAFHVPFKEPCLVVFRAMKDAHDINERQVEPNDASSCRIPPGVMNARSLSTATKKNTKGFNSASIEAGRLLAFDAEFVSVQEEEAALTDSGSKMILRETRHAIGRISAIDCKTREVILDDHVLPREPVVDYLTRFSGIVAEDLDTSKSPHNLISTRSAYLKLRCLMEKGCIFLGHGLRQDFATVNLIVPPHQILDTVEIFHQPGMRYISLRFLANFILKRDMQQDIHCSVEDASAAFELYEKALEWKRQGTFDKKLQEIYTYGGQTDWKLGVSNVPKT